MALYRGAFDARRADPLGGEPTGAIVVVLSFPRVHKILRCGLVEEVVVADRDRSLNLRINTLIPIVDQRLRSLKDVRVHLIIIASRAFPSSRQARVRCKHVCLLLLGEFARFLVGDTADNLPGPWLLLHQLRKLHN